MFHTCSAITGGHLGQVSEVVTLHLQVEDLGLWVARLWYQELVQELEDILANVLELLLDLLAVLASHRLLPLAALGLLLNARDDAPRRAASADHILVGDREQVPLLVAQLVARLGDLLHCGRHVVVSLGLLGQLCSLHLFFFVRHVWALVSTLDWNI